MTRTRKCTTRCGSCTADRRSRSPTTRPPEARIDRWRTLREHCAALGVAIEFGRKVDDIAEFADCDLVVAADGAASRVSTRIASTRAVLDVRAEPACRYGYDRPLRPVSLVFRENEDGAG